MKRCFAILITEAYRPFAEVCKASILRHMPGEHVEIDVIDAVTVNEVLARRPQYIIDKLLKFEQVVFLGADIYFMDDAREFLNDPETVEASIRACPHRYTLPENAAAAGHVYKTGLLNSDFVVYNACLETIRFLQWQRRMVEQSCVSDPSVGLFYDQTFLAYALQLPNFKLIRNNEYNVAWYNVLEEGRQGIKVFQFSGYDPSAPATLTKYNNNPRLQSFEVTKLCLQYYGELVEAGWRPQ